MSESEKKLKTIRLEIKEDDILPWLSLFVLAELGRDYAQNETMDMVRSKILSDKILKSLEKFGYTQKRIFSICYKIRQELER